MARSLALQDRCWAHLVSRACQRQGHVTWGTPLLSPLSKGPNEGQEFGQLGQSGYHPQGLLRQSVPGTPRGQKLRTPQ